MRTVAHFKFLEKAMKTLKLTAVFLTSFLALSATAEDATYEITDNSHESKLCLAIAEGKQTTFKNLVKRTTSSKMASVDYKAVANEITCNGANVSDFADKSGKVRNVRSITGYFIGNGLIVDRCHL